MSEEPIVAEPPAPALRDAAVAGSIEARAAMETRAPSAPDTIRPPPDAAHAADAAGAAAATVAPGAEQQTPAVEDERLSEQAPAVVEQLLSEDTFAAEAPLRSEDAAELSQSAAQPSPDAPLAEESGVRAAETIVPIEAEAERPDQGDRAGRAQALTEERRREVRPYAPAPAPPVSPDTIRRRRLVAAGAGVAVLVIAAVVIVLLVAGGSGKPKPNPAGTAQHPIAQSGPIKIQYAAPWRPTAAAVSALPGVMAGHPVPIQLASGGVNLLAGALATSATIPGDVPPALRSRYGPPATSLDATVGGARAREYRWTVKATGELDAFVVPTGSGDLALICNAPSGGAAGMPSCASLATAATLTGAQLLAPGPDLPLGADLSRSVAGAATARGNLKGLQAGKLSDRASAASTISKADASAATSLAQLSVPVRYRSSVSGLSSALRTEGVAFAALSRAAQRGDRKGYASASKSVTSASKTVASAASALRADGLSLPALSALGVPGLPPPSAPKTPAPSSIPSTSSSSGSSGSTSSQTSTPSQSSSSAPSNTAPSTQSAPSGTSSPPPASHSGGGGGGGGGQSGSSPTLQ